MIAEIIINSNARALNKVFDYIVPKEMEKEIFIGARVFVPFGKSGKLEDGFVIGIKNKSEFANKEIAKITNDEDLSEEKVELAKLMAKKYFCNISDCIRLMLPPGTGSKESSKWVKEKTGNFVNLAKPVDEIEFIISNEKIKSEKQKRVLNFLIKNDDVYITDLQDLTDTSSSIIKTLEKNGYVKIEQKQIERNPFVNKNVKKDNPKKLTEEQQVCFDGISKYIENEEYSSNLIFGITGSRKNRNLFAANRKSSIYGKIGSFACPRNFTNATNCR